VNGPAHDPIRQVLAALGVAPGGDPLGAVDDLLRGPGSADASRLVDRLLPELAKAATDAGAARTNLAAGAAFLAMGDAPRARELLLEGLAHLPAEDASARARGSLQLARAENALGSRQGARAILARSIASILALEDDGALSALAVALRAAGDPVAGEVVEHHRRSRSRPAGSARDARLDVIARIVRALGSSLGDTAEPLHAILGAILDEAGGERGFLMLYDQETLRFEVGLARDGRILGQHEFRYSTTIVAAALEAGRPVVVPDLSRSVPFAEATSALALGIRSAVCAPLRSGRKRKGATGELVLPSVRSIAGVLYVDGGSPASFTEEATPFLEVLADAALVAVRAAKTAAALKAVPVAPPGRRPHARRETTPAVPLAHPYEEIVTRDPRMRETLALVDRLVPSDANVVIRGESGTGKELVARALHRYGPRRKGPFVAIDCGAVPDELVQSELFGHEKDAFTGAVEARTGLVERAHGGTLLLDELGEMSPAMQATLLRALQEGEVRRLGGDRARPFDVRIVCATNRDLRSMVERGAFRHDLFFRLCVVEVKLPPLRERREDVALLVDHCLRGIAAESGKEKPLALEPEALARLEEHGWPGNVRELENVLRSLALTAEETIGLAEVDEALGRSPVTPPAADTAPAPGAAPSRGEGTLEAIERRTIVERLERFRWNQVQAAESMGIDRRTLYRKIRRYGIGREHA
jgi:transcriptional regulator with GAF, ATPase, and Fis domain